MATGQENWVNYRMNEVRKKDEDVLLQFETFLRKTTIRRIRCKFANFDK